MVERGQIRPETAVRASGGFWGRADQTPGVAPLLGCCPSCRARVEAMAERCPVCDADLWHAQSEVRLAPTPTRGRRLLGSLSAIFIMASCVVGGAFLGATFQLGRSTAVPPSPIERGVTRAVPNADDASVAGSMRPASERADERAGEVEAAMEAPVPAWRDAVLRAIADGDLDRGREVLAAAIESGASDAELAQWADLIERLEPLDRSAWVP